MPYLRSDTVNTAIVFYSMSGNTRQSAEKAAAELGAELIEIKPKKAYPSGGVRKFLWGGKSAVMGETPPLEPYVFDADKYDRVVFASPVWAGNIAPPVRTFIKNNALSLRGKRFSALLCCSGGGFEKALNKLRALLEVTELEAEAVLIDPLVKPSDENEKKLGAFCEKLK